MTTVILRDPQDQQLWECSNNHPQRHDIWTEALGHPIGDLDGQNATDIDLTPAITWFTQHTDELTARFNGDPTQGDSLAMQLTSVNDACRQYPDSTVHVTET